MATRKALKPKDSSAKAPASDEYAPREARKRFELAVDVAVATKPIHKEAKPKARH